MTRAIIGGKLYNTETAYHIGRIGGEAECGSFYHWEAELYQTPKGSYFMEGSGGPRSPFAERCGLNWYTSGEGIRALEAEQALAYAEANLGAGTIEVYFGEIISEA